MSKKDNRALALAMIQPEPMPGAYQNKGESFEQVYKKAEEEVEMLKKHRFDGYIIQNRNDAPIRQKANTETIAFYSVLAERLKKKFPDLVQGILINWDGVASLAVAEAANSDFIRIEHTYTGVEVGYAGLLEAECVEVCEFKKRIGSNMKVYADVQEIHYEQIGGKPIVDAAADTIYNAFADGIFLAGNSTEESIELAKKIRKRLGDEIPIFLGGGSTGHNISELMKYYDGVSVGSWVKNGNMRNPIDPEKAKIFIDNFRKN